MTWAPGEITILLHIHCTGEPLDAIFPATPWRDGVIEKMRHNDLICARAPDPGDLMTTDRGRAYVHALCNLPLPECSWVIPS